MRKHSALTYYHIARANSPKPSKPIRPLIPKSKNEKLDEYILEHDTITRDQLEKLGISRPHIVLKGSAKRTKTIITQIDYNTWDIKK